MWLEPFDAALDGLTRQRALAQAADELVSHVAHAMATAHAYIRLGGRDGSRLEVRAGQGRWALDGPDHIDAEVRLTGEVQTGHDSSAGAGHRYLAVPVLVDGEVAGSVGVAVYGDGDGDGDSEGEGEDAADRWPDPGHLEVLRRFARLAAVAYASARLITTERSARDQEKALIRAGQALSSTLELRDVLNRILSELQKVVPYDTASVQELRGDQMVIVGGKGIDMDVFAGVGFDVLGDGVPNADVLRHCAPVIVPDILGDHPYFDFPHDAHQMSGVRGWLGVPLVFRDACIGMLTLDTFAPDFYTDDHADTALAFAAQAAIALQNARSFALAQREVDERRRAETELRRANETLQIRMGEIEALQADLRDQAVRDALTGLFNRRHLMDTLQTELARCDGERGPLTVVMIDVDHFKQVNDQRGHAVGDQVLIGIASYLSSRLHAGEVACRYGGEEFVVLLPGTDRHEGARRAEVWRREIEVATPPADLDRPITVSIGVADRQVAPTGLGSSGAIAPGAPSPNLGDPEADDPDGDELMRRADAAMYRAKAKGRNRVEVEDAR